MPYVVRKTGSKKTPWCVFNKETDESKGCSTTKTKAYAHIRAMMAAEHSKAEESLQQRLDRIRGAFREATTPVVSAVEYPSDLYVIDVFDTYLVVRCWDTDTYWRVDYLEDSEGQVTIASEDTWVELELVYVPVDDSKYIDDDTDDADDADDGASEEKATQAGILKSIQTLWQKVFPADPKVPKEAKTFYTKEQADGQQRWVAISSTAFLDGHQEIVATEGIDKSLARAKEVGRGDLRFWHLPSVRLGSCDMQLRDGVALVESGLWDTTEVAIAAQKALEADPDRWGVSIGFLGLEGAPAEVNGTQVQAVWTDLQIIERSLLPATRAATKFSLIKTQEDGGTAMKAQHEEALKELLGDTLAGQLVQSVDATNAASKGEGVVFREGPKAQTVPASSMDAAAALIAAQAATPATKEEAVVSTDPPSAANPEEPTGDTATLALVKEIQATLTALQAQVKEIQAGEAPKAASLGPPRANPTSEAKEKEDQPPEYPQTVQDIAATMFPVAG